MKNSELKLNLKVPGKMISRRGLDFKDQISFCFMFLPTLILVFVFCYIPMVGLVMAFQSTDYNKGIFNSPWVGFKNFEFFFKSDVAWRVTRNTVGMNLIFIILGTVISVAVAIMLFEIKKRYAVKAYQTIMILPNFISWVVVSFMVYALLNSSYGIIDQVLVKVGIEAIDFYNEPKIWPFLLFIISQWKGVGMGCIIYYASLMGINEEYYEAAVIDGATKWQIITKVMIPFLVPVMIILMIMSVGGIFRSDFGLFYQVTRDSKTLYPTVDVIDTYIYRALQVLKDTNMSTAIGLYQSFVGFIMIMGTNYIIKRIDPEKSFF